MRRLPLVLRLSSCLILAGLVVAPLVSRAQCPVPSGAAPALGERSAAERVRFLTQALEREASAVRTWRAAWGATYALGTLGQLAATPLLDPADQQDFAVGAASTAVGVAFTILGTPEVMEDAPAFSARVAAGGDECQLLAEAEALMVKDAANEASSVAWYFHAANVAFNLGVGLAIGLGFGHWVSALINFLVGAAIGEGTLFTQPVALAGAWSRYLTGSLAPTAALRLAPAGVGLFGLALAF